MRASKPFLRVFFFVLALTALWVAPPQIGQWLSPKSATVALVLQSKHTGEVSTVSPLTPPSSGETKRVKHSGINPSGLAAGTVWTFHDGAVAHTYAIAMDELYVPADAGAQRIHRLSLQPSLASLLTAARSLAAETGTRPQLILYPLVGPHDEASRRMVTMKVHIETDNLARVQAAVASLGLTAWQTLSYAPGHAIAQVSSDDPSEPLRIAALIAKLPDVTSATPLLASQRSKKNLSQPTDTFFSQQWHLQNTGQQSGISGIDINVTPVWPVLDGTGINIGIVDDGLQISHPDLSPNVAATGNYDWNGGDTDPSPDRRQDFHGTACAGLAAARDNGFGVVGAAPEATLYGLRLIALPETDQDDADAMHWENDVIQIKSNSWGPPDDTPWVLGDAGSLWLSAVADSTATGRGGLGTIFVWASGNGKQNGDQGSKDGYSSNVNVIPVGAITNKGVSATFSEGGAHLVVCAPGDASTGLVTTDLVGSYGFNDGNTSGELSDSNYTKTFAGTSASTPIAAGVIALMLEANPNLGWRDVKEILLRSSTQIQPADTDWVTRDGGQPSLPAIKHHPFYGGGLINAQAATALAATWTNLDAETVLTTSTTSSGNDIPDAGTVVTIPLNLHSNSALRVEHVELILSVVHPNRGDLEIKLTSPSGTVSTLATPTTKDDGSDYDNWVFTSVRHWGETSIGTWTISLRDARKQGTVGHFVSATLKVHGVVITPPSITLHPQDSVTAQGAAVMLTVAGDGQGLSYQWAKNGSPVTGAKSATLSLPNITLAQAGTYACTIANPGGSATSGDAKVVVYNGNDQTQTVNPGVTYGSPVLAAGPIDSFQWLYNAIPLANTSRITGVTAGALTVRNVTTADNGSYTLQAMFNGSALPTGAIVLTVRVPPAISAPSSFEARVGATVPLPLVADGGGYTYRYVGLPKGLSYSTATGAISGRTTSSGSFPLILTATDSFGNVTTLPISLVIDPLPANLVGMFNGIVARDATLDQNLGGTLTFTTTAGGLLTGQLALGSASPLSFKGLLDGAPGADATTSITIPRKGLSSLQLLLDIPVDGAAASGSLNSTVDVAAWRNSWTKVAPATAYAGHYTFALETPAGSGWPAGYSTGMIDVATTGAANWTLLPADGTAALKGTAVLAADGTMVLFAPIKTPAGSFLGFLTLPPKNTPDASITGMVSWLRGATTSALYANPAGFGPLDMTVHGGRYTAPAIGTLLLGLQNTSGNATIEFGGADVNMGAQAQGLAAFALTIANLNKVVLPAANPTALKLTINTTTGLFSGTFTLTDPNPAKAKTTVKRAEKFSGVLLLQDGLGAGFFDLPAIPGSGNGTRSGAVLFIETPPAP